MCDFECLMMTSILHEEFQYWVSSKEILSELDGGMRNRAPCVSVGPPAGECHPSHRPPPSRSGLGSEVPLCAK